MITKIKIAQMSCSLLPREKVFRLKFFHRAISNVTNSMQRYNSLRNTPMILADA